MTPFRIPNVTIYNQVFRIFATTIPKIAFPINLSPTLLKGSDFYIITNQIESQQQPCSTALNLTTDQSELNNSKCWVAN